MRGCRAEAIAYCPTARRWQKSRCYAQPSTALRCSNPHWRHPPLEAVRVHDRQRPLDLHAGRGGRGTGAPYGSSKQRTIGRSACAAGRQRRRLQAIRRPFPAARSSFRPRVAPRGSVARGRRGDRRRQSHRPRRRSAAPHPWTAMMLRQASHRPRVGGRQAAPGATVPATWRVRPPQGSRGRGGRSAWGCQGKSALGTRSLSKRYAPVMKSRCTVNDATK